MADRPTVSNPPSLYGLQEAARNWRCGAPATKLVLLTLITYAGLNDGEWSCFPGIRTLAHDTEQSEASVKRHLHDLKDAGVVEVRRRKNDDGRGSSVACIVIHPEAMTSPRPSSQSDTLVDGTIVAPAADHRRTSRGPSSQTVDVSPLTGTSQEQPLERAVDTDSVFATFWSAYPRKTAKADARKAFTKAAAKTPAPVLIAAAFRYAADPNRDPTFTPHPATWLNGERWDDEPCRPRSMSRPNGRPVPLSGIEAMMRAEGVLL